MHVILVADIHLSDSPEDSFGVDTKANFMQVLARIKQHEPDHVVHMGDYSHKAPQRKDVAWAFAKTSELEVPFSFIAGNHDRSVDVGEVTCPDTPLVEGELYYRKVLGDSVCLFLDTAEGEMSELQRVWLADQLRDTKGPTYVFMHHPPIEMGVPYMDENHCFRDEGGEVANLLFENEAPVHVFSGHYHTARNSQVGIHSVHLCPSTFFQLDPNLDGFGVSHTMPGIRHVKMLDGQMRTWIEFLPKN